jgi:hypothetical protein
MAMVEVYLAGDHIKDGEGIAPLMQLAIRIHEGMKGYKAWFQAFIQEFIKGSE